MCGYDFIQYFLLPFLLGRAIVSCILSNTLYALATIWYAYITHLGYRGELYRYIDCILLILQFVKILFCINSTTILGKYASVSVVSNRYNILFVAVLSHIDLNGSEDKYFENCDGLSFRMKSIAESSKWIPIYNIVFVQSLKNI